MRSELGWERGTGERLLNNVSSLSRVEAPREVGWSLYRELERWTWRRNGVRARKKNCSRFSFHCLLSPETKEEEKREKKVSEMGFLDLTWLVNSTVVSAPATGPNQDQALFLNIHPGPGQTDGSGIQLFKSRQGRVGIKSRAGWMDDWHRGIFYCKSLIIEDGVICCPLITLCILTQHHPRAFESNEVVCFTFA